MNSARCLLRKLSFLSVAAMTVVVAPASAHHSATIFDTGSVVAFQGTVTRLSWTNPHVYIYVEAQSEAGERLEWEIETDATPILTRSGWTSESLMPGDPVMVRAHPDRRSDERHALLISIAKEDGEVLAARSYFLRKADDSDSRASASDLSGVWELGFADFRGFYAAWGDVALTERGVASRAEYDVVSDSPQARCIAIPPPASLISPNLNEILIEDDAIVIKNERFNVERIIYTDGRGHPENGERSNQGHSVGRWEGDVLVVDTTLFEPHRSPVIGSGVASGLDKHLSERFALSPDGTQIVIDFVLEDPEYLAEPFTGRVVWHYAPHFPYLGFDCDPENARRFTLQ